MATVRFKLKFFVNYHISLQAAPILFNSPNLGWKIIHTVVDITISYMHVVVNSIFYMTVFFIYKV